MRRILLAWIAAWVVGCGARSDIFDGFVSGPLAPREDASAGDGGRDASLADATWTDARDAEKDVASLDARGDVARGDAGRDAPPRDGSYDAPRDAGVDSCDRTGGARGTVDTIASLGDGGIVDFDVDCSGIVLATSEGAIVHCPVLGCTTAPATVAKAGTYALGGVQVRIASVGLYVTSGGIAPPLDGGLPSGIASDTVYLQPLDGGSATAVAALPTVIGGLASACFATQLGASGATAYFSDYCSNPAEVGQDMAIQGAFEAVTPTTVRTFSGASGVGWWGVGAPVSGNAYYTLLRDRTADTNALSRFALNGSGDAGIILSQAGDAGSSWDQTEDVWWDVVATDEFVSWFVEGLLYACAPGSPCPISVNIVEAAAYYSVAGRHDTLFLSNGTGPPTWEPTGPVFWLGTGPLVTCSVADLAAGSCTPDVLAPSLPPFRRVVATDANVYVLTAGGVLRIAR